MKGIGYNLKYPGLSGNSKNRRTLKRLGKPRAVVIKKK